MFAVNGKKLYIWEKSKESFKMKEELEIMYEIIDDGKLN